MNTIIEKIRAEVNRLKGQLIRGACAAQIQMETSCKDEAYDEMLSILSDLEKECEEKPNDQWSEEDEKMLSVISYKISQHQGRGERNLFTPEEAEFIGKIEDNLKSLRKVKSEKPTIPESEGEAISWKPTENDLMMLEHIIGQYEIGNKNCKTMGYLPRVEELSFLKKVLSKWKN